MPKTNNLRQSITVFILMILFFTGWKSKAFPSDRRPSDHTESERASDPNDDTRWSSQFGFPGPGTNGGIYATVTDRQGNLYVGGSFTQAGDVPANHIAKWDGKNWSPLGSGVNGNVVALGLDSMGNLYVGGRFTLAGKIPSLGLAKWDGLSWHSLSLPVGRSVGLLTIDSTDNIYANVNVLDDSSDICTNTYYQRIMMWNGEKWSDLSGRVRYCCGLCLSENIDAMATDKAGNLYVSGYFSKIDDVPAYNCARWDGVKWSAVDFGTQIDAVAFVSDSTGNLFASGLNHTGGISPLWLAEWNGSSWSRISLGSSIPPDAIVRVMFVDQAGDLCIFWNTGILSKWNGMEWSYIKMEDPWVTDGAITNLAINSKGTLYAAGTFLRKTNGIYFLNHVARYDGSTWQPLGDPNPVAHGLIGTIRAIARGPNGTIYVGGEFYQAGNAFLRNIAKWDGTCWTALGSGVDDDVYAMATDSKGNLYVAGDFSRAGEIWAPGIAKWDGVSWSALGFHGGSERTLAVDSHDILYASGYCEVNGKMYGCIQRWDGSNWSILGPGISGRSINAIAVDNAGNVYAGGFYLKVDGTHDYGVARWDGRSWSAVGLDSGKWNYIKALAIDKKGDLYAIGAITTSVTLAQWDGIEWHFFPSTGSPNTLAADKDGNVYIGGNFCPSEWKTENCDAFLTKWDGSEFSQLASLPSSSSDIYALSPGGQDLYVGGSFTLFNGKPASSLAKWVSGQTELSIGACNGFQGGPVTLHISLDSTASVSDLQFDLVFDPAVLTFHEASVGPQADAAGKSIVAVKVTPNRLRVTIGSSGNKTPMGNGVVAHFQFAGAAGAPLGSTVIRIEKAAGLPPQGAVYGYPPIADVLHNLEVTSAPVARSLYPASGPVGSLLVLKGSIGNGICPESIRVLFSGTGGYQAFITPLEIGENWITVLVPSDAHGTLNVSLQGIEPSISNPLTFAVTTDVPYRELPADVRTFTPLGDNITPSGVAIDTRSGMGFLADSTNRRIVTVDPATGDTRSHYYFSEGAVKQLAIHPATRQLVATIPTADRLGVLYVSPEGTMRNPSLIEVGDSPFGVDLLPSANRAVVTNRGSDNVSIVDLDQAAVLATVKTGRQPAHVAVDRSRSRAFVVHIADNSLWEIDLTTYQPTRRIANMGSSPNDLGFYEEAGMVLVGLENGLLLYRPDQGQTMMLLEGEPVHALAIHPDRGWAVVVSNTDKRMTTVNLSVAFVDPTRAVVGSVPTTDLLVQDMALNPWTNRGLFVGRKSGSGTSAEEAVSAGFAVWTMPSSMNFPRLVANPTTGIFALAISNPTTDSGALQLTAMSDTGQQLSGLVGRNPATVILPAHTQMARYETDPNLFGSAILTAGDLWHKLAAPNPGLKAFFLTADAEFKSSIVGAEESGALLLEAILPAVRPGASHLVSLLNPLPVTSAITWKLIDNAGTVLQTVTGSIPAYGSLQKRIEELFPTGMSRIGSGGYVRVSASTGIRGYQLLLPDGKADAAGFNAQSAVTGSSQLHFAYFAAGQEAGTEALYETRAGIVNLESSPQAVTLTIRNNKGVLLAPSQRIQIPGYGRIEPDLLSLFQLSAGHLTQGWLQIIGSGRLSGYLTYGTQKALAAVVSMAEPQRQLTFSHVAEVGTGFFTGLALLNTNAKPTSVIVSVYRADGRWTATGDTVTLAANEQRVALLHQLAGSAVKGQAGGYVLVESTLPIQGIEIFGTDTLSALANVPAQ